MNMRVFHVKHSTNVRRELDYTRFAAVDCERTPGMCSAGMSGNTDALIVQSVEGTRRVKRCASHWVRVALDSIVGEGTLGW